MFLVEDKRHGSTHLVFTWDDPRKDGYKGDVADDVSLDYDMRAVHSWPDGQDVPEACVGRATDNPKLFKVFRYRSDLQSVGFQPVAGMALVFGSWREYVKLRLDPPDPVQTPDEQWYGYLDKLDEDSRRRRENEKAPEMPAGKTQQDVAAWIAKKHLFIDPSIREIWYLPKGAPANEIRLLELNDRLATAEEKAEAVDFGVDVNGAHFLLFVADITSEELEQIKRDSSRLPKGWSLEANTIWRRGA